MSGSIFVRDVVLVVDRSYIPGINPEASICWLKTRNGGWFTQLYGVLGRLERAAAHGIVRPVGDCELRVELLSSAQAAADRVSRNTRQLGAVIYLPGSDEGWLEGALEVKASARAELDSLQIPVLALAPRNIDQREATALTVAGIIPVAPSRERGAEFWPTTAEHGILSFLARRCLGERFDPGLLRGIISPDSDRSSIGGSTFSGGEQ